MNDKQPSLPDADEATALAALAEEYGLSLVVSVPAAMLDPELVTQLPVEWARRNSLLPVRIEGESCVLTTDPGDVEQQENLALLIGEELRPVLAPRSVIADSIERCYYSKQESPQDFMADLPVESRPLAATGRSNDLLQVAEQSPVTQLINLILLEAVKRGASDIHFEPFATRLRLRYRVDGVLYDQSAPPKHMEDALISRLKVMARMDIAEKRLPQEGVARVRVGDREIDIRVSSVPVAEGERIVLRILDRDSALLPLNVLGMASGTQRAFEQLLQEPNGIIVVSGPTGSGKTTTLYAALQQLDSKRKNILTIENPIEYQLPDIGQIQVKPKIGLTFASGLRQVLRQDPDIILVGETRDVETAEVAIRASLTGHLVFTTLHTNDAPGAVLRLVDMGVEPYLLASCMRGVLAQRLVRRLCVDCRREVRIDAAELEGEGDAYLDAVGTTAWAPVGCDSCLEGFKGRLGLFELMVMDNNLQSLVRSGGVGADEMRAAAVRSGMTGLVNDGLSKLASGETSLSELLSVTAG